MNNEKHGIPALLSFFICGLGQLTKNHFGKFFAFFIAFVASLYAVYTMVFSKRGYVDEVIYLVILFPVIIWFWSINDAYNSNVDIASDTSKIHDVINEIENKEI